MNKRIKKIRKELGLTQQEFANKLGVKRNTIANYETGRNTPIDPIIFSICREFDVSEEWLKNGTGEMFVETEDDIEVELMRWAGKALAGKNESFKKKVLMILMALDDDDWDLLDKKIKKILSKIKKARFP